MYTICAGWHHYQQLSEEAAEDMVPLGETMWDASLLLGVGELGTLHSIIGLFALLANTFVQLVFAVIVVDLGADDRITDETAKAFQFWRLNIAHRLEFYDPITETSLAARVCSGDDGIELSEGDALACLHDHH